MERKEVEALVTDLTMLIEALPACSTIEPVALKAQTSAGVYETSYTRDCVDNMTSEYLDIFFKDHESHISVIADSRAVALHISASACCSLIHFSSDIRSLASI